MFIVSTMPFKTTSSSIAPFSCLPSFPALRYFPMRELFASKAKVLELQLQHQSFQWIFRVDFLLDWLVWSCSPRDSLFDRISLTLSSILNNPETRTRMHMISFSWKHSGLNMKWLKTSLITGIELSKICPATTSQKSKSWKELSSYPHFVGYLCICPSGLILLPEALWTSASLRSQVFASSLNLPWFLKKKKKK